jgi:polysaccharide pyruvyl transferase WcaK-like protein
MVERLAAQVVFIPMERENQDIQHSHAVVAKMQNARHATVLRGEYSPPQLIGLANHFAFAVGMRLHFLIFAALAGVPFIALPYASKVHGLVADLELDAPPMERVTVGQLIAVIDRAWDHRDEIRVHVTSRLPALQARARMTHQRLLEMLQPTVV